MANGARRGGGIMKTITKLGVLGLIVILLFSLSSTAFASYGKKTGWHGEDEPPALVE